MKLEKIKSFILDILFPKECINCRKEGVFLCDQCLDKIELTTEEKCVICKRSTEFGITHNKCRQETYLDGIIIAGHMQDKILDNAIHRFKYNFVSELGEPLAELLIKKIRHSELPFLETSPLLVPIPLHRKRLNWRGFNQAEVLAKNLNKSLRFEFSNLILERKKKTKPQAKSNKQKRTRNMAGAFVVNKEFIPRIKNTHVLLVDDVLTTGVTMEECAKVLKRNGVSQVWGVVLGRG